MYFRKGSVDLIQDEPKEPKKKQPKSSTNIIPKESNLTEDRINAATNVMLISQKHYCDEHERSCYINGPNHLYLTPQHLSTWAASIVRFYLFLMMCFISCRDAFYFVRHIYFV